jgi:hypothetical protein
MRSIRDINTVKLSEEELDKIGVCMEKLELEQKGLYD